MIVADGCGGARGGEFAAQLTIETLVEGLTQQEFSPTTRAACCSMPSIKPMIGCWD